MFSWNTIPRPIVCLAPMAGYTDSPYRQIVKEICPRVICFTEFTNVAGLLHGNEATLRQVTFNPEKERPIIAQIFGNEPEQFRLAAAKLTELGVDAIDINMGCPARKVVSSDCGSSLLKDAPLAEEIVRATIEGTRLPVSVKMRIGISGYDADYFFRYAKRMEDAGANAITIHGRTSKQMYGGTADWNPMYEVKKILRIPVIGNGDIKSGADALAKIGNLDGVMAGRGSFGNPWVFQEIFAAFEGQQYEAPNFAEKIQWIMRHTNLTCGFYEKEGNLGSPLISMRKQFAWYIRGVPHASQLRQRLMQVKEAQDVFNALQEVLPSPSESFQELQPAPTV